MEKLKDKLNYILNILLNVIDYIIFLIPSIVLRIVYYKNKKKEIKKLKELENEKTKQKIADIEKEINEIKENEEK